MKMWLENTETSTDEVTGFQSSKNPISQWLLLKTYCTGVSANVKVSNEKLTNFISENIYFSIQCLKNIYYWLVIASLKKQHRVSAWRTANVYIFTTKIKKPVENSASNKKPCRKLIYKQHLQTLCKKIKLNHRPHTFVELQATVFMNSASCVFQFYSNTLAKKL